jgi:hypothetical protein
MMTRCACGNAIAPGVEELGCIQCGRACCRACGISLESVTYCSMCASALLEAPTWDSLGALSVSV